MRWSARDATLGDLVIVRAVPTGALRRTLSLTLHDVVERVPAVKSWIENGASAPGLARTLSYQYHYLTGVKAALRG